MVFLDTSALFAFLCSDDQDHARVKISFEVSLHEGERLAASSYVVSETMGLVQHRMGLAVLRRFMDEALPSIDVHWIGRPEHDAAWKLHQQVNKRDFTIVDASSAVLMRRHRVRTIATLDPEFARLGFRVIPQ